MTLAFVFWAAMCVWLLLSVRQTWPHSEGPGNSNVFLFVLLVFFGLLQFGTSTWLE